MLSLCYHFVIMYRRTSQEYGSRPRRCGCAGAAPRKMGVGRVAALAEANGMRTEMSRTEGWRASVGRTAATLWLHETGAELGDEGWLGHRVGDCEIEKTKPILLGIGHR